MNKKPANWSLGLGGTTSIPDLAELPKSEQIEAMIEWFHENYEDPAQETPYVSAEGGYQYIWGGPYEANEELFDAFGSAVEDETIIEAAERIESESGIYDWAPSGRRIQPEGDDEFEPNDSVDEDGAVDKGLAGEFAPDIRPAEDLSWVPKGPELRLSADAAQAQVVKRLNELESGLEKLRQISGSAASIGHNNPPEPITDPPPITAAVDYNIRITIEIIHKEVVSDTPDANLVREKAGLFRRVAKRVGKWLADVSNKTSVDLAKAGVLAALALHYPKIMDLLNNAYDSIVTWLSSVF